MWKKWQPAIRGVTCVTLLRSWFSGYKSCTLDKVFLFPRVPHFVTTPVRSGWVERSDDDERHTANVLQDFPHFFLISRGAPLHEIKKYQTRLKCVIFATNVLPFRAESIFSAQTPQASPIPGYAIAVPVLETLPSVRGSSTYCQQSAANCPTWWRAIMNSSSAGGASWFRAAIGTRWCVVMRHTLYIWAN